MRRRDREAALSRLLSILETGGGRQHVLLLRLANHNDGAFGGSVADAPKR